MIYCWYAQSKKSPMVWKRNILRWDRSGIWGHSHLWFRKKGNFGGRTGGFSGQARNLSPQQTALNTFESDVMGMTPIDNWQLDNL